MKKIAKIFLVSLLFLFLGFLVFLFFRQKIYFSHKTKIITNFEECVFAGNLVLESYPKQCIDRDGFLFVEEIDLTEETINENKKEINIVGGDKDKYGCIGSAGYSWCPPREKCLRIWEENCYESTEQEIQYFLADKYSKSINEIKITIIKQEGEYLSASVLFSDNGIGEGGILLAKKFGNIWEVIFDGNGSLDCFKLRNEYQFPDSILKPNFCD